MIGPWLINKKKSGTHIVLLLRELCYSVLNFHILIYILVIKDANQQLSKLFKKKTDTSCRANLGPEATPLITMVQSQDRWR